MRKLLTVSVFLFAAACLPAAAEKLKWSREFKVEGTFLGKDHGELKTATNLSGAACPPPLDARIRHCLAIDDQGGFAQFFDIEGDRITLRQTTMLIEGEDDTTLGEKVHKDKEARHSCLDEHREFKDLDGEGVAFAKGFFYVVGSHGCARDSNDFNLAAFILARFPANGAGKVETTYRLADALKMAPRVQGFFGKNLNKSGGLNIEGLAIVGEDLIAGLRAPSLDGSAFLIKINTEALFAKGHDRLTEKPAVIPVALGRDVGIRDLAALSDGRLLVLAGPTLKQDHIPFSVYAVDLASHQPKLLAILEEDDKDSKKRPKVETMVALGEKPLRLLVFFDGPKNGAPKEYIVPE